MEAKVKKYLAGVASDEELKEVLHWLENEDNQVIFKNIKNEWKSKNAISDVSLYTINELDKFRSRLLKAKDTKIKTLTFLQNLYKYAAIILLLITLGGIFYYNLSPDKASLVYNTVIAENGQISKAVLPDNTVIWLNSGTTIRYSNQFGVEDRNVELNGQAYFDVTRNEDLPFIVSCDEINVKVLGTQFSAESYSEQSEINVVLVKGSVELVAKNCKDAFAKLKPSEMLVYTKADNKYEINTVVAEKYTSWREGVIHFYDTPLKDVVAKLYKRYNQKIELSPNLEDYHVTFSIRNEKFEDVLNVLAAISPSKVYQKGDIVYVEKK
ncbi:FecR family protein [Sunxiuqinia sp. A32]|uniref:FecR family protein n=1 Tax=Sunxiuqinia sp. A32 TaxID=3461496 RepID=UPI004045456E